MLQRFDLFSVTPIGIAFVASGLIFFVSYGKSILPEGKSVSASRRTGTTRYMRTLHGVRAAVREAEVPSDSNLAGMKIDSVQAEYDVRIVASRYAGKVIVSPPVEAPLAVPATLAIIARPHKLRDFVHDGGVILRPKLREFRHLLSSLGGVSPWMLQAMVTPLASAFSLVMFNVGATVLLVPFAINLAFATGANPTMFALTVAIPTSNSFLIPTHQVNALIMGPGDYRAFDFMRAGSIMTVVFLVVSLLMLNIVF